MRCPENISKILSRSSRSRKQYRNTLMAPMSMACVSQPHQVAGEARQLGEHHAHPLRHGRDLQTEQPLDRQRVTEIVGEVGQIVHAVRQRDHLLVGLFLALLLDAGVQEADVGLGLHDDLAVQFQQEAEDPVRGRVLRAHVEDDPPAARIPGALLDARLRSGRNPSFAQLNSLIRPCRSIGSREPGSPCAADVLPSPPAA